MPGPIFNSLEDFLLEFGPPDRPFPRPPKPPQKAFLNPQTLDQRTVLGFLMVSNRFNPKRFAKLPPRPPRKKKRVPRKKRLAWPPEVRHTGSRKKLCLEDGRSLQKMDARHCLSPRQLLTKSSAATFFLFIFAGKALFFLAQPKAPFVFNNKKFCAF